MEGLKVEKILAYRTCVRTGGKKSEKVRRFFLEELQKADTDQGDAANFLAGLGARDEEVLATMVTAITMKKNVDKWAMIDLVRSLGLLARHDDVDAVRVLEKVLWDSNDTGVRNNAAAALASFEDVTQVAVLGTVKLLYEQATEEGIEIMHRVLLEESGLTATMVYDAFHSSDNMILDEDSNNDSSNSNKADSSNNSTDSDNNKTTNVQLLLTQLREGDGYEQKEEAANLLGELEICTRDITDALLVSFKHENCETNHVVRAAAGRALIKLASSDRELLRTILASAENPKEQDDYERSAVVTALEKFQETEATKGAVTEVEEWLRKRIRDLEEMPGMRYTAARTLVERGVTDDEVIGVLTAVVKDPSAHLTRLSAAHKLVLLGKRPEGLLEALIEIILDEEQIEYVRKSAVEIAAMVGESNGALERALISVQREAGDSDMVKNAAALVLNSMFHKQPNIGNNNLAQQ